MSWHPTILFKNKANHFSWTFIFSCQFCNRILPQKPPLLRAHLIWPHLTWVLFQLVGESFIFYSPTSPLNRTEIYKTEIAHNNFHESNIPEFLHNFHTVALSLVATAILGFYCECPFNIRFTKLYILQETASKSPLPWFCVSPHISLILLVHSPVKESTAHWVCGPVYHTLLVDEVKDKLFLMTTKETSKKRRQRIVLLYEECISIWFHGCCRKRDGILFRLSRGQSMRRHMRAYGTFFTSSFSLDCT